MAMMTQRLFQTGAFALAAAMATVSPAATDIANVAAGTMNLPAGYTQLEYVQTSGGETRFTSEAKAAFSGRIEAKVSFAAGTDGYLWGSRTASGTGQFCFGCLKDRGVTIGFSGNRVYLGDPVENEPYLVNLDYDVLQYSVRSATTGESLGASGTGSLPAATDMPYKGRMIVLAVNDNGSYNWPATAGCRIYYIRYFGVDGNVKLDLVPARRDSDGYVCFYDLVEGKFKTLSGGSCVAGPSIMALDSCDAVVMPAELPAAADKLLLAPGARFEQEGKFSVKDVTTVSADVPAGFTRLASLHVNSHVVFKTNYKPGNDDEASIKIRFGETGTTGGQVPFLARTGNSSSANIDAFGCWYWKDAKTRWDFGFSGTPAATSGVKADTDYIMTVSKSSASIADVEAGAVIDCSSMLKSGGSVAAGGSYMWLLGTAPKTTDNEAAVAYANTVQNGTFYEFKATRNGVLYCHYVPARRKSDNVAGIYDIAGGGGFITPTLANESAVVTAGDAVAQGVATIALAGDVSLPGTVTGPVPLALVKSSAASGDVKVSMGVLSGVGGISVGEGVTVVLDPIRCPVSLASPPVFAPGAKIALADSYAGVTCGKIVLMTWSGAGEVALPAFDASCVGGAPDGLTVETAPDGTNRLVLRWGGYEQNAKSIRVAPIGDSITQGVTKDSQGDYPQYRSSMAAHLAAHGYKPVLCGIWKYANLDRAGAPVPDEWAWHTGVSGDAVVATDKSGGAMDNLHLYLDVIGKPDVITLLVGTNDMGRNGKTAEETYVNWTNLVWEIVRQRPNVKIVASTVLDRKDNADGVKAKVAAFNTLLKDGKNAGDLPANLSLVDLFAAVPLETAGNFFSDELHPNWQGHAIVAKGFADGIMSACPYATFMPTVDDTATDEAQSPLGASAIDELAGYRRGFNRIYTIDAAETNSFPNSGIAPYTATNTVLRPGKKLVKVGYYMGLVRKGTNRRRWVWVDMDACGKTLDDVALPWDANTERPRQFIVEKLHVKSNDSAVHAVEPTDDTVRGVFEGTPWNYSAGGTTAQLAGAPANLMTGGYGWNDDMTGTSSGFGCFQMHRIFTAEQKEAAGFPHDAEVLFAWNRWGSSSGGNADDIGIGTYACHVTGVASSTRMGNLDYSQSANGKGNLADTVSAKAYQVRRIEIWAKVDPDGMAISVR